MNVGKNIFRLPLQTWQLLLSACLCRASSVASEDVLSERAREEKRLAYKRQKRVCLQSARCGMLGSSKFWGT